MNYIQNDDPDFASSNNNNNNNNNNSPERSEMIST